MKTVTFSALIGPSRQGQACVFCGGSIRGDHVRVDSDTVRRVPTPDERPMPRLVPGPDPATVRVQAVQYVCRLCVGAIDQTMHHGQPRHVVRADP